MKSFLPRRLLQSLLVMRFFVLLLIIGFETKTFYQKIINFVDMSKFYSSISNNIKKK